ncbi:alpha/beta fold hydrolase [Urechidicola sp. KH5]
MNFLKKVLKILAYLLIGLLILFIITINIFFKPFSDDEVREFFDDNNKSVFIQHSSFRDKEFRIISTQEEIDSLKPTLILLHGSPGGSMDFKAYLVDDDLRSKANLLALDRVGYSENSLKEVQPIAFEQAWINRFTDSLNVETTILAGYSYGGPIALASQKSYKKVVIMAGAVSSEAEPMFWFVNFYKWRLTRWMMPKMLEAASVEKIGHPEDLQSIEQSWGNTPANVISIHGDVDWIVPYENSIFLENQFSKEQYEILTLTGASHDLIWSRFEEIKQELIKVIEE